MTPVDYFKLFWDDNVMTMLVEQTNLYSVQTTGNSIRTNIKEMEQLVEMQMMMSLIQLPSYEMYWNTTSRIENIASIMPIKLYELLCRNLHVVRNNMRTATSGKLSKVKHLLDAIRSNCLKLEQEQNQPIDEQMIPAMTKRSGIQQYLPKKIHKWGFKNFVRAGELGITYDFFIYSGTNTLGGAQCSCEDIVLRLIEYLHAHQNFRLFLDNWFSTISLMQKLNKEGILVTATFRLNRIGHCPLTAERELKHQGRGSFDYRSDQNSGFIL